MRAGQDASAITRQMPQGASGRALVLIAIALAISITLNVLLAHKVHSLSNAQLARMASRLAKVGTTLPPIIAKRLDGQQDVISYQGTSQPTVLYVFTPPCTWCARNMDNFKTLVDKEGSDYRFIGLSLSDEGLEQYVTKNELKVPIYSGLSSNIKAAYKLFGTPQTIVISPDGKVLQNWPGAYVGDQKSQVEAFFHVTLPGLRELPKAEAAKN